MKEKENGQDNRMNRIRKHPENPMILSRNICFRVFFFSPALSTSKGAFVVKDRF
jgi:hypothetical protein